jgi:hypothetical protein
MFNEREGMRRGEERRERERDREHARPLKWREAFALYSMSERRERVYMHTL